MILVWFSLSPCSPSNRQRKKKKNEDTFEYNVTYQVPSHYRTVFREREKTPESSKRIGPLQFPLIQPSQETFLYDQANDDTCYLLYAYSNPSPMCNALQGLSCSLLATLWGSDSNKSPFCRWRHRSISRLGICPRSMGSLVADLQLNFRSKIKPIKTVLITTQLFSFPWPVLGGHKLRCQAGNFHEWSRLGGHCGSLEFSGITYGRVTAAHSCQLWPWRIYALTVATGSESSREDGNTDI